jgi:copper transport protein
VAATALWIGGIVALLLAVPAATRRIEPAARTRLLAGVLARFSPIALWSVVALAITGGVQARSTSTGTSRRSPTPGSGARCS